MKQSETIANLAVALVKANGEIKAVLTDSKNPDFGSKYASLDAIIEHTRPILAKNGLAIVQGATTPHTTETGAMAAFAVETMLVHSSGEWLANTAIMPVVGRMLKGGGTGEVTPQSAGSALTYGRRYGLSALLCIATDEDDDGNKASASSGQAAVKQNGTKPSAEKAMPFGKQKGKALGTIGSPDLESTIEWCTSDDEKTEKFKDLVDACSEVLRSRMPLETSPL